MEAWTDLYKELAERINDNLTEIRWFDLWHNQISFLTSELPFPTPSLFVSFKTIGIDDKGLLVQDVNTQIDFYLFYETFSDTYLGSSNQDTAINFMQTLTDIHKLFHGVSGINFGIMRRVDMNQEDASGAGNLYRISFQCLVEDASAMKEVVKTDVSDVTVDFSSYTKPSTVDDNPLYQFD